MVPEGDLTTRPERASVDPLGPGAIARPLIGVLLLAAGVVHLVLVPDHAGEWLAEGVGFAVVGWLQLAGAVLVVARCRRWVLWGTVALNALAVALWAWSRTTGFPVGPGSGVAEPVGAVDRFTVIAQVLAIGFAVVLLVVGATWGSIADLTWPIATVGSVVAIGLTTIVLAAPSTREHAHADHD